MQIICRLIFYCKFSFRNCTKQGKFKTTTKKRYIIDEGRMFSLCDLFIYVFERKLSYILYKQSKRKWEFVV